MCLSKFFKGLNIKMGEVKAVHIDGRQNTDETDRCEVTTFT